MINWKIFPKDPDVAKFVECYWFLEKEQIDDSHKYPKLNPDPSGTLIIAPNEQKYQYDNGTSSFEGMGSHWIFPNCQTFQMDHSQAFLIFGIKSTPFCRPILLAILTKFKLSVKYLKKESLLIKKLTIVSGSCIYFFYFFQYI